MTKKQMTPARYVKLQGLSIKDLTEFCGYSRWTADYRFKNDRELLDSDIKRCLEAKEAKPKEAKSV